eukprot:360199-Chlamydomonas_euryale.AAC.3
MPKVKSLVAGPQRCCGHKKPCSHLGSSACGTATIFDTNTTSGAPSDASLLESAASTPASCSAAPSDSRNVAVAAAAADIWGNAVTPVAPGPPGLAPSKCGTRRGAAAAGPGSTLVTIPSTASERGSHARNTACDSAWTPEGRCGMCERSGWHGWRT